jgi:hypothetical protein
MVIMPLRTYRSQGAILLTMTDAYFRDIISYLRESKGMAREVLMREVLVLGVNS